MPRKALPKFWKRRPMLRVPFALDVVSEGKRQRTHQLG